MSFKKLADRCRGEALWRFLQAADSIPGVLVTFLVDKDLASMFDESSSLSDQGLLAHFKPATREKLARVTHLLGLLVAGLSHPGQDLHWFTDDDEIASNEARLRDLIEAFARVSSHVLEHDLGHFRCGTTTATDPGDRWIEDLTAIPDLAGGALVEVFTHYKNSNSLPTNSPSRLTSPLPGTIAAKTRVLVHWLANANARLAKVALLLDANGERGLRCTLLRLDAVA